MATPVLLTVWMLCLQAWIRHEMLEKLEKENLETLVLRTEEIHWKEKGKELLIDGQLFDVLNMTPTAAGYRVSGLWDTAETAIKNNLDQTLEHQQERREQGSQIYAMILGIMFYPPPESENRVIRFNNNNSTEYHLDQTDLPPAPCLSQPPFPPDFC
jgi:hypothetical protein